MATGKPLTVKLTADSQLKQMPDLSGMMGMMGRGGAPAGGAPPNAAQGGPPAGGMPGGMAGRPGGPGRGMMDIAQMLEHMPPAKLDDLKPGQTIVVSSTKGVKSDEITAIMLLSNADMLIQMASMGAGRGAGAGAGRGGGMNGGGMGGMMGAGGMGDMSGFGMPSIIF